MSVTYFEGIGRRKEASARVRIMAGTGSFIVNSLPVEKYFTRVGDLGVLTAPMKAVGENLATFDISVVVKGGGVTGQTTAVQLGIARALLL